MPDQRLTLLTEWLESQVARPWTSLEPASADASFRRYFRLQTSNDSFVVMDAPPDKEPIAPFLRISHALAAQSVHVPKIFQFDETLGFIVMEDLGRTEYLSVLPTTPNSLYTNALQSLIRIQLGGYEQANFDLPHYNRERLEDELNVFEEWYLGRHLHYQLNSQHADLWRHTKKQLMDACLEQPQVWVHRDYHSRNLMHCDKDSPGVIDYQDMVLGPLTYDLVSLLKDCYIEWPRAQQLKWCREYHERLMQTEAVPTPEFNLLVRWFDLTGMQRHLKVLGVFARLHYRDGKSQYLKDLLLVKKYLVEALDLYPEFSKFGHFFNSLPHDQ